MPIPRADAARALLARTLGSWLGPWVQELTPRTLRTDLLAGLLGAVLVLPQAIAFAALVGVPPAMGLATAVLPCLVAALAGSSRLVLSGPTNATSLALGAMLLPLASGAGGDPARTAALAVGLTLLVGLMQLLLAVTRLGAVANFISPSVMLGFTGGAALLIAWSALGQVLGGSGRATPLQALQAGVSPAALAVAGATLATALLMRRLWRRGPHVLLALLLAIGATWLIERQGGLAGSHVARLGTPPAAWLGLHWPPLDPALLAQLLPMALALTIIALGQSISIAKLLAARSGHPLDANRECFGQGLANTVGAFAGCFVACGSLNRSLPNLEAGARTPLAGASAALWLLALVALGAPLLAWVPLAGVGALLLLVAAALVDRSAWRRLWRLDRREFGIAAATLVATLTLRLEIAILAGVMLSLVAWLYRSARPALRTMGFDRPGVERPFVIVDDHPPGARPECPQLKLLRMEGSVWFGAVPHVAEHLRALRREQPEQRHLLVMAKSMNAIDLAGADLWDDERIRRREAHGDLYFHRPRPQVITMWRRTGFDERLGVGNVFADKHSALRHIVLKRLDDAVCAQCTVRLFDECSQRPGAPLAPMI